MCTAAFRDVLGRAAGPRDQGSVSNSIGVPSPDRIDQPGNIGEGPRQGATSLRDFATGGPGQRDLQIRT